MNEEQLNPALADIQRNRNLVKKCDVIQEKMNRAEAIFGPARLVSDMQKEVILPLSLHDLQALVLIITLSPFVGEPIIRRIVNNIQEAYADEMNVTLDAILGGAVQ